MLLHIVKSITRAVLLWILKLKVFMNLIHTREDIPGVLLKIAKPVFPEFTTSEKTQKYYILFSYYLFFLVYRR